MLPEEGFPMGRPHGRHSLYNGIVPGIIWRPEDRLRRGLVVLLPILWAAIYLDLWKAFVVVLAVVAMSL